MEEGNRLIMEGRYAEALAKYRELTNRAPDSAAARDAVQKTEVLLADQQKRDTRAKEISDRIEAARQAQSVGDDDRAIAEAEMALGLDPENSDARALKEASEARKTAVAKTASDQQKKDELAKKKARVTPTPFRVVETKKEPVVVIPPTPTPATASLKVYFDCPITDGYVMIRQNDKEIFRRSINFGRKSQGGIIEGVVQVSAGKSEFKIWVISTDNSVRQYLPSTIEVPGGENRTLRLELDTNKKLSVYLR
jgi:tetratricopeptide (TPR) repeat protein